MVAVAIRMIFAQPTTTEVVEQVDKVAAMLAPRSRPWPPCWLTHVGPDRLAKAV
jgi:hypothetical protein